MSLRDHLFHEESGVTLYCGDARALLPELLFVTTIVTDPPYGIGYAINARSWGNEGLTALKPWAMAARPPIQGDLQPFDPAHLLGFKRVAIFGANHMAGLPIGGRWIAWDKRRDSNPDSHSDREFVWTNVPGADRIHRQKWRGIVREGEENCSRSPKLHPNQKPVALIGVLFDALGIDNTDVIADPYMGSGPTGVVARRRGLPFIGIDIEPTHCETAVTRLRQEALR